VQCDIGYTRKHKHKHKHKHHVTAVLHAMTAPHGQVPRAEANYEKGARATKGIFFLDHMQGKAWAYCLFTTAPALPSLNLSYEMRIDARVSELC